MRTIRIFAMLTIVTVMGCATPLKHGYYTMTETRGSRTRPVLEMQGYLRIDGVLLPDAFRTVSWQGATYRFLNPIYHGGDHGYHPMGPAARLARDDGQYSASTYQRGWVAGVEPSMAVPEGWLYVTWDAGSAYVRPDRIDALIEARKIPFLSRHGLTAKPVPKKKRLMVPMDPKS